MSQSISERLPNKISYDLPNIAEDPSIFFNQNTLHVLQHLSHYNITMVYDIQPLQHSEIDEYTKLRYVSFENGEGTPYKCFYPQGYTPGVHAFMRRVTERGIDDPNDHVILIRNASTKEIMGAARWQMQLETKSIESLIEGEERSQLERAARLPLEGVNYAALDAFNEAHSECHRDIMHGQPHFYLGSLVVHPRYQRLGIGAACMKWGLDKADGLGLPAYLEATKAGKGLYERWGFKVERVMPWDSREFGDSLSAEHYCMVRDSRKVDRA